LFDESARKTSSLALGHLPEALQRHSLSPIFQVVEYRFQRFLMPSSLFFSLFYSQTILINILWKRVSIGFPLSAQ